MNYDFKPQPKPADITALSTRYMATPYKHWTVADEDQLALDAGYRLVNAGSDMEDAKTIVRWKSPRRMDLFELNTPPDVEAAIKAAIAATRDGDVSRAVTALMQLDGVGLKMATAFLTAMFPTIYTVCDIRASEALGQKDYGSLRYYVAYLAACRRMAAAYGVTLRDFDRANWQWSKERSQNNRKRPCSTVCGLNAWDMLDAKILTTERLDPETFSRPLVSPPSQLVPSIPQEDHE
jgi:hypothetical protein